MMNETRSPRVRSPRAAVKFVTRDDRVLEINRSHRLGNDPVAQCASGDSKVEELSGAAAPDDTLLGIGGHRRMRPLRYSINGCCDHRAMLADEDLHRHAVENLVQADALLFGRVTYEMMEAAWRSPARTGAMPDWMAPWMQPFART